MSGYSKQCFIVWVILYCLYDVHNMTQQKTTCCSCFALKDQCASDDIYWQKMYEIKTKTDTRITESSQIRTSSTFSGKKFHVPFGTRLFLVSSVDHLKFLSASVHFESIYSFVFRTLIVTSITHSLVVL